MSYPVDPADLPRALEEYAVSYLLTVTPSATVKAVTVRPRAAEGAVFVGAGRSSAANASGNPAVTLLCPPVVEHGFTLIVDGTATVTGDEIRIDPTSAILHRPPYHSDGPPPPDYAGGKAAC